MKRRKVWPKHLDKEQWSISDVSRDIMKVTLIDVNSPLPSTMQERLYQIIESKFKLCIQQSVKFLYEDWLLEEPLGIQGHQVPASPSWIFCRIVLNYGSICSSQMVASIHQDYPIEPLCAHLADPSSEATPKAPAVHDIANEGKDN